MENNEKPSQTRQIDLSLLTEPIDPRWRVQSCKGQNAICVPYIDARAVHERLDLVCGAENWQNTYDAENGVASIGIRIDGEWIWKSDVGTDTKVEAIKGKSSDAFKRAAVLWGIGRDLYFMGTKVLPCAEGKYAKTLKGETLLTGEQLTNYINSINESTALLMQIVKKNAHLNEQVAYQELIKGLLDILKKEGN